MPGLHDELVSLDVGSRKRATYHASSRASAVGPSGPGGFATRGFKIYNLSSHPLVLRSIDPLSIYTCDDTSGCYTTNYPLQLDEHALVGQVLAPGAPPQDFELRYYYGYPYGASLQYYTTDTGQPVTIQIRTFSYSNDSTCIVGFAGDCTADGLQVTFTDPPGTVHDIPAGKGQE